MNYINVIKAANMIYSIIGSCLGLIGAIIISKIIDKME